MVDSARTPQRRNQGIPALPVNVAGIDGIGPITPTNLPVAPTVSIPDRSQEFLARSDQSVQNAFDIQQQNIESSLRANMAEAEARGKSRNQFGQSLAGALEAASAIFMNIRDKKQLANAAQFDAETREFLFRFHQDVAEHGMNEGTLSTNLTLLKQLREHYKGNVAPEVLQSVSAIGYNALIQGQQQFGQRKANELADARAFVLDQRAEQASLNIVAKIVNITQTDPLTFSDPLRRKDVINGLITEQLDALPGVTGLDRLKLEALLRTQATSAMNETGMALEEQQRETDNFNFIINEGNRIQNEYADNPVEFKQQLLGLQVISDRMGLDIDVLGTFLGPVEASGLVREHIENLEVLSSARNQPSALAQSSEYTDAKKVEVMAGAVRFFNDPAAASIFRAEVEGKDNPSTIEIAILKQLDEIEADRTRVLANDRRRHELLAQQSELEVRAQRAVDQLDPENRIDVNLSDDGHTQQVYDLLQLGVQQGRISPETEAAIRVAIETENRAINAEIRQLRNDTNNTLGYYRNQFGWDLRNPRNTQGIADRREQVAPVLQEARRLGSNTYNNQDFQWGL